MGKKRISQKDGECSHTDGCKVYASDKHNERTMENCRNENIRPELTKNNTVWKDPDYPSLPKFDHKCRKDYADFMKTKVDKLGRPLNKTMPSKGKTAAHPVKETILLLPSNGRETDEMVDKFVEKVENLTGWKCIRKFVHRDEVYTDIKTGESKFNNHAQIVWDCYDFEKHEIKKVGKEVLRLMQDFAAEVTGMPRGIPAEASKSDHYSVMQWKWRKKLEELCELEKKINERNEALKADPEYSELEDLQVGIKKFIQDIHLTTVDKIKKGESPKEEALKEMLKTIVQTFGETGQKYAAEYIHKRLEEQERKEKERQEAEQLQKAIDEATERRKAIPRIRPKYAPKL